VQWSLYLLGLEMMGDRAPTYIYDIHTKECLFLVQITENLDNNSCVMEGALHTCSIPGGKGLGFAVHTLVKEESN